MIPLYLDPAKVRIALIGRGPLAVRRLRWLRGGGAEPDVWSDQPDAGLVAEGGSSLHGGIPDDLMRYHAIWIADLPAEISDALAENARKAGVLVNVEDVVAQCDFHTPAVVRRGKLTLTAGTGGASPAVARAAREQLEAAFPTDWAQALNEIADARAALRARGVSFDALVDDARVRLTAHGLI